MMPDEMIYTAMKVDEWKEGIVRKELREYELRRKEKQLEKKKRMEERNEALRNLLNRK